MSKKCWMFWTTSSSSLLLSTIYISLQIIQHRPILTLYTAVLSESCACRHCSSRTLQNITTINERFVHYSSSVRNPFSFIHCFQHEFNFTLMAIVSRIHPRIHLSKNNATDRLIVLIILILARSGLEPFENEQVLFSGWLRLAALQRCWKQLHIENRCRMHTKCS